VADRGGEGRCRRKRALLTLVSSTSLQSQSNCKRCSAPLHPGAIECLQCHALVHADDLERIAKNAKLLESQGKLREARDLWLAAIPMLPGDAKQAAWIHNHAVDLYARALEAETAHHEKRNQHEWAKRFGPLAPLVVLLSKAKGLLVLFKLKFLFSLFTFVGFYWAVFGKWFGIGFAALVFCHEMGHFLAVKVRHLPVEMPVFLPGFGAYVRWRDLGVSLEGRCAIALAGPFAGLISSAACMLVYQQTGSTLWLALANTGAWLNLLNLVPVWALDGGHAIEAVSRLGRILLATIAVVAFLAMHNVILLGLAAGAGWQAFRTPSNSEASEKITIEFALLICALAALLWVSRGAVTPF
jgi:Zn-dependent protease